MGDHYIPRHYLKGFAQHDGKQIWVYDKQDQRQFPTQVKSIANETRFYSPKTEQYLANTIEGPANLVLDKIRQKKPIDDKDKDVFAQYIVVMIKRVPESKTLFENRAPLVAQDLHEELRDQLNVAASVNLEKQDFYGRRGVEIKEILDEFAENPPKKVWLGGIPPELTPRILEAIRCMKWSFLTYEEGPAFLSCDNPVFFFRSLGIGSSESEISFPISSNISLWLSWQRNLREGYYPVPDKVVKEMNRRMASNASRYVFHPIDESWIIPFISKEKWQLHRLG
ncbi:DUF4238 domain-containing protein [Thermodesulfobacteriota bacterium]